MQNTSHVRSLHALVTKHFFLKRNHILTTTLPHINQAMRNKFAFSKNRFFLFTDSAENKVALESLTGNFSNYKIC